MPGPKRTAAAAATLAFSAVPLPLASASHAAKPNPGLRRPAPVTATRFPHAPTAAATTPVPAATSPQAPATAAPTRQPAAAAVTTPRRTVASTPAWRNTHPARHDVRRPTSPKAHAAGDPGNTITDFKFSPGTMTIHVGDTVTWTNSGASPHTATADNGSFETGTLAKGASASHTFTQSGTFAYICKIHPFMKGTVVVLAASTTPTSNPSNASGAATNNPSSTPSTPASASVSAGSSSAPTLPVTGLDVLALIAVGLGLLALGTLVRRRAL